MMTDQIIDNELSAVKNAPTNQDVGLIQQMIKVLPASQQQIDSTCLAQAEDLIKELELLGLGEDACKAAVLYLISESQPLQHNVIAKKINAEVAKIYQRVIAMNVISNFSESEQSHKQLTVENLRRMLLAMVDDVRVVLIKLSHQLILLRTVKKSETDFRSHLAQQTLDIFAPLANRLGVWQLKWELEDLSLRYLRPQVYKDLALQLAERRIDREKFIDNFIANLSQGLASQGVSAKVYGRPKHIYSIWRKMQRKGLDFDQIYDVRAVRILVDDITDCYTALGVVHTSWPNIAAEFDDYIAVPKKNGYRSIHTAVVGEGGKVIEVQIRTHEMHEENELGIAAHWRYKEGTSDLGLDNKILWLRQLLEWKEEVTSASDIIDEIKTEVVDERVYVFTPGGEVIDLPLGATPIDFAYSVHTEVGHRCRGARVNGRIVGLNYQLETGQQVEVLTIKKGGPSRDWLSQESGYAVTHRARARIQRWFKEQDRELSITEGRHILERELHRLGVNEVNHDKLAQANRFKKSEDLLAAIGFGDIKISQVVSGLAKPKPISTARKTLPKRGRANKTAGNQDAIHIEGVGNLLTQMAKCCSPVPGDEITGFITVGRGVTIHRMDCGNILRLDSSARERLIQVNWGRSGDDLYRTDVFIKSYDRSGLLNDITAVFVNEQINVLRVNSLSDPSQNLATFEITIEIADADKLSLALGKLAQINNVIEVKRLQQK